MTENQKELSLTLRNVSIKEDKYGHHMIIKQVGVYQDGKFIKNAKINQALIERIKKGKIIFNH